MNSDELISSGLIEMYCLGLASADEVRLVEKLAATDLRVNDEIVAVRDALRTYMTASEKSPSVRLKDKILTAIKQSAGENIPPRLTLDSKTDEWINYLKVNNISPPENFDPVHFHDLPGNATQVTYVVWARKGVSLEESHDSEDEILLMMQGTCAITIEGKIKNYSAGDVISISKNLLHKAEATSDDMILIGQRIAA